jgi:hypothetical protein
MHDCCLPNIRFHLKRRFVSRSSHVSKTVPLFTAGTPMHGNAYENRRYAAGKQPQTLRSAKM